ncbi:MAG: homoserine kinase, partial [Anaerolineales bacterium]|nr:homoserine kinase [Anaerolineales bacterium]
MKLVNVKVPATSANLGPGYDCLGLSLGLYNEFDFMPLADEGTLEIIIEGEGADFIPRDESNLIVQAAQFLCDHLQRPLPAMKIIQRNYVPPASGMGSSSTAVVAGMLGVNEILKAGLTKNDILELATNMEGHPDNVAPALYGGLVLVPMGISPLHIERFEVPPLMMTIILPEFNLLTQDARAALPAMVSREDAIFNLARTPLVIRALEQGNY